MNEEIRKKIIKWIFENHQHHGMWRLDSKDSEDLKEEEKNCKDFDFPYVNSIELEQFINTL